LKSIPAPLLLVIVGTVMNELFITSAPDLALDATYLVSLPVPVSISDFFSFFTVPDFGHLTNMEVYTTGFTLAVIASIESLLSVEATDKLDRLKRITPSNRELKAQGAGNIIAGLIGGIPVTQVIVRSAANVDSGGKTRLASFFHGVLLLIGALFFAGLLNRIPLSCLASILLVVGYMLTRVTTYREMYRLGWQQFFPFIVTVTGLVFTDMLTGVMLGMVVGAFHILVYNYKTDYLVERELEKHRYTMRLSEHMSFLNKASLTKALSEPKSGCKVFIDSSNDVILPVKGAE
jgi:MFS superfamily sulfate permease-like transporter